MRLRESILYLVSVKARILETPCSPEIASERGWDRVCSGITRGEIIWLFLLPVIYYLLHKYADVQTFNYNIYLKSIKKSLVNFYKFYVFISLRVCVCVASGGYILPIMDLVSL